MTSSYILSVRGRSLARRLPLEATKALVARRYPLSLLSRFFSGPSAEGNQHVVVALGGNALLKRKQAMTVANQRQNIREGMESLKSILQKNAVTMVHGNGPVSEERERARRFLLLNIVFILNITVFICYYPSASWIAGIGRRCI